MHADSYFTIGKTHTVCQDYARAGVIPSCKRSYAIVSDGCSSSPDTDFGSRILTVSAVRMLAEYGDEADFHDVIRIAQKQSQGLIPSNRFLDATLLIAHEQDDGTVRVQAYGDGLILAIQVDGTVDAWEIDMAGYPGYLSYILSPERMKQYIGDAGTRTVRHWVNGQLQTTGECPVKALVEDTSYGPVIVSYQFGLSWVLRPEKYKCVIVATDGAMSFKDMNTQQAIGVQEVLPHITDIRSPTGEFMLRSSRFFLDRTCPKLGWRNMDDYGVAAIWMEG